MVPSVETLYSPVMIRPANRNAMIPIPATRPVPNRPAGLDVIRSGCVNGISNNMATRPIIRKVRKLYMIIGVVQNRYGCVKGLRNTNRIATRVSGIENTIAIYLLIAFWCLLN